MPLQFAAEATLFSMAGVRVAPSPQPRACNLLQRLLFFRYTLQTRHD